MATSAASSPSLTHLSTLGAREPPLLVPLTELPSLCCSELHIHKWMEIIPLVYSAPDHTSISLSYESLYPKQ